MRYFDEKSGFDHMSQQIKEINLTKHEKSESLQNIMSNVHQVKKRQKIRFKFTRITATALTAVLLISTVWLLSEFLISPLNKDENQTSPTTIKKGEFSFEEKIQNILEENDFRYEKIIDYDLKGDFIYVVTLDKNDGLDLAILKNNSGELEWITGPGDATILGDKGSPFAYLIQPNDARVIEVKVFGETVRSTTYYDEVTEDFTREIKYWISYTEDEPTPQDVEYILK